MRNKGNLQSRPTAVCFCDQNPVSLEYLTHLLRGQEFEVVGGVEAFERERSSPARRLILAFDEKDLAPGRRLSMRSLRIRFPWAKLLILGATPPSGERCDLLRGCDGFVLYS